MPLQYTKQINASSFLGLWKTEEPAEELQEELLKLRPGHETPGFKSNSRTREWLGARILAYSLLKKLTPEPVLLKRQETGQPICSAGEFQVSLSHSGEWVAALVSASQRVGIDIELRGNKVPRLVQKFLNEEELQASAENPEKMHLYWSAKETLYKAYSHKKLLFKENILLQDFELKKEGQFKGSVQTDNFRQDYDVCYKVAPEYVLTYVLT